MVLRLTLSIRAISSTVMPRFFRMASFMALSLSDNSVFSFCSETACLVRGISILKTSASKRTCWPPSEYNGVYL